MDIPGLATGLVLLGITALATLAYWHPTKFMQVHQWFFGGALLLMICLLGYLLGFYSGRDAAHDLWAQGSSTIDDESFQRLSPAILPVALIAFVIAIYVGALRWMISRGITSKKRYDDSADQ